MSNHICYIFRYSRQGKATKNRKFSIQCFCDGKAVVPTPAAQDHKRAFDGDKGPNTGGMGSYSMENHLLPFLTQDAADQGIEITRRMAAALYEETGEFYKGNMYGGYILTREGVKLIEYNARFADPESMNVLTILVTDFVEICRAIINEELGDLAEGLRLITAAGLRPDFIAIVTDGYTPWPTNSGIPKRARLGIVITPNGCEQLEDVPSRAQVIRMKKKPS